MGDFTHLHVHSHYSLLDGLGKVKPILERTKELGMDSVALTDHGSMYGTIELVQTAQDLGVKPIIGVEAYLALNGHDKKRGKMDANPCHVTLLAQNTTGYKNMIQLTTKANLYGYYYKPRIDYALLQEHNEGLIVLSGCLNGHIPRLILEKKPDEIEEVVTWYLNVFGRDRFYFEVQDHPNIPEQIVVNEALIGLAQKHSIGLTATADSHYIHPDDAEAQDVLVCVQTGKTVQDTDRLCMTDEDYSLASPEHVKEVWKNHPEAVDNTVKIAEMCDVKFEFGVNKLPPYPLPQGETPDGALRELCEEGVKKRYNLDLKNVETAHEEERHKLEEIKQRLDYELEVIGKTGYASYFLIVQDFVNEARDRGILVGPGRGSAAGSLVAYLTRITNVDPLYYKLLFERFLNPERVSMPDIDLDFADDRRAEVIDYVREKYGADHVSQIITFGTMAARAAIRDAGRALDLPYAFCDQVAKLVPMFHSFDDALENAADFRDLYNTDPQAKKLIDMARKLEGVCRHASTHAAAVVITDAPLTEYVPLQRIAAKGSKKRSDGEEEFETVTQYEMNAVESLGLLKMDFLGLKNLSIIQQALNRIEARHGVAIDLDTLELDNKKAYELLQEGKTTGVFQLESAGMKRYLKELKPTEFEDIISMCALYRPGPMDSIPDFILAKHGKKKITFLHPKLEPILRDSYGIIVTQDQVLMIAREFAGFSYAEADILRKAVGKKIKKLLDEQREKFVSGAVAHSNVTPQKAREVWDFIEPFARYGFNRAHAACYAMIAYQTAYLKANYPADFMAALLTCDEGNMDRQPIEVAEAIHMDIPVLAPDINESDGDFTVVRNEDVRDAIRWGLNGIKNVGRNVVAAVVAEREKNGPYQDLFDCFRRIDNKDFNKKSIESMAKAGAFDSLSERQLILENLEDLLVFHKDIHKKQDKGQQGLFGEQAEQLSQPKISLKEVAPAEKDDCLRWEKELLGLYVSEHPLTQWQKELQGAVYACSDLKELPAQKTVRVAGVISAIKKILTKKNDPMLFVTLEDLGGSVEVLVFPRTLSETSNKWVDGASVIVEGKLSDKDDEVKILTDKVWELNKFTLAEIKAGKTVRAPSSAVVRIQPPHGASVDTLRALKRILTTAHSESGKPVELVLSRGGAQHVIATEFRIEMTPALQAEIANLVGAQVWR